MLHYWEQGKLDNLKEISPYADDCKLVCTRQEDLNNGCVIHFLKVCDIYYVIKKYKSTSFKDEVYETNNVIVARAMFMQIAIQETQLAYQIS